MNVQIMLYTLHDIGEEASTSWDHQYKKTCVIFRRSLDMSNNKKVTKYGAIFCNFANNIDKLSTAVVVQHKPIMCTVH